MNGSTPLANSYVDNTCLWGGTWEIADVSDFSCLSKTFCCTSMSLAVKYIVVTFQKQNAFITDQTTIQITGFLLAIEMEMLQMFSLQIMIMLSHHIRAMLSKFL